VDKPDADLVSDAIGEIELNAADLDCSGSVNVADFGVLLEAFCTGECATCPQFDYDNSGCTSVRDRDAFELAVTARQDADCSGSVDADDRAIVDAAAEGDCVTCDCSFGWPTRDLDGNRCVDDTDRAILEDLVANSPAPLPRVDMDLSEAADGNDAGDSFAAFKTGCAVDECPITGVPTRDLDGSGCVDAADVAIAAAVAPSVQDSRFDFDRDCHVDLAGSDLRSLLSFVGAGCEAVCPLGCPTADFDGDGCVAEGDLELLESAVLAGSRDLAFDLDGDCAVNAADEVAWAAREGSGC
jgi:hypothetical protein